MMWRLMKKRSDSAQFQLGESSESVTALQARMSGNAQTELMTVNSAAVTSQFQDMTTYLCFKNDLVIAYWIEQTGE